MGTVKNNKYRIKIEIHHQNVILANYTVKLIRHLATTSNQPRRYKNISKGVTSSQFSLATIQHMLKHCDTLGKIIKVKIIITNWFKIV